MALVDLILALNPILMWPLDRGDASGVADFSGHSHDGTLSGDYALNAVGPEIGTHALRLFNTGQVISTGLGMGGEHAMSIGFMVAADVNALGQQPFAWIGNPSDPTTRGMRMIVSTNATPTVQWIAQATNYQSAQNANYPQTFWHWVVGTFTPTNHHSQIWVDGQGGGNDSGFSMPSLVTTDPLIIRTTAPTVVTMVTAWDRVLTQAEVQTVANGMSQWPWTLPINSNPEAPQTPVTVDLTPVLNDTGQILANQATVDPVIQQTKQDTTNLMGFWNGYTNVTLPSLNDTLAGITNAVTATIEGAAGAVTHTIGDLLSGLARDQWATLDIGTACAPDYLQHTFATWFCYGIQMQCTSFADWYVWTGNADDYTTQALGTLQIFRGGNLVLRQGLHTATHSVIPLPGIPELLVNASIELVPPDYTVVLTPAPETCWHLDALKQP